MTRGASDYNEVAEEYYDAKRHPTCANFREASEALVRGWMRPSANSAGRILEVGAGRSIVAPLWQHEQADLRRLMVTDKCPRMLAYSAMFAQTGARLLVADAVALPFLDATVSVVVASLGDPYNTMDFWREVNRVLKPNGSVLFTTPSYEWALEFRARHGHSIWEAEFETGSGRILRLPSVVLPEEEQQSLVGSVGLRVEEIALLRLSTLRGLTISPKLLESRLEDPAIVTGYRLRKPYSEDK